MLRDFRPYGWTKPYGFLGLHFVHQTFNVKGRHFDARRQILTFEMNSKNFEKRGKFKSDPPCARLVSILLSEELLVLMPLLSKVSLVLVDLAEGGHGTVHLLHGSHPQGGSEAARRDIGHLLHEHPSKLVSHVLRREGSIDEGLVKLQTIPFQSLEHSHHSVY